MKRSRITAAMDYLDEDLVENATKTATVKTKPQGGFLMKSLQGWKKWTAIAAACVILLTSVVGLALLLNQSNPSGGRLKERDMYAMSAISSVQYLTSGDSGSGAKMSSRSPLLASASAATRPDGVSAADVEGIQNCLAMFDGVMAGGNVSQSVTSNQSTDPRFSQYENDMSITIIKGLGGPTVYKMYFTETGTRTETEFDDGEEETETTTTFRGVFFDGTNVFDVLGKKEVEIEGNETETSLEFTTYRDAQNYVTVSQSVENDETEYEYEFYRDGRKVQEMEIEYEKDRGGEEVEFRLVDVATGVKNETSYELKRGKNSNAIIVKIVKNGNRETLTVTEEEDGSYTITYANGYTEKI